MCLIALFADLEPLDKIGLWLTVLFAIGAMVASILNRLKLDHLEHQINSRVDQLVKDALLRGATEERRHPTKD